MVLLLVLMPRLGWAEDSVLVLVGGHGPVDDVAARVADELTLRGHSVTPGALSEGEGSVLAEAVAARHASSDTAVAVGVWLQSDRGARVVVVARTGEPVRQAVDTEPGASFASAVALVAGEAVDLALERAREAEVRPPQPTPAPAPTGPKPPPRPRRSKIEGDASAAVEGLWPVHLAAPMARVGVAVGLRPSRRVRLALRAGLPLHPLLARVAAGRVHTLLFELGPRLDVDLLGWRAPVALDLRLGADLLAVRVAVRGDRDAVSTGYSGTGRAGLWVRWRRRHLEVSGGLPIVIPFERLTARAAGDVAQDLSGAWLGLAVRLTAWW